MVRQIAQARELKGCDMRPRRVCAYMHDELVLLLHGHVIVGDLLIQAHTARTVCNKRVNFYFYGFNCGEPPQ